MDIHTRCKQCFASYAVKRIKDTINAPITYCIYCGANDVVTGEDDADYWGLIARDLGMPATAGDIVRSIFDTWTPAEGDSPRFIDFARELVNSAKEEGVTA